MELNNFEKEVAREWRIKKCGFDDFGILKGMFFVYLEKKEGIKGANYRI